MGRKSAYQNCINTLIIYLAPDGVNLLQNQLHNQDKVGLIMCAVLNYISVNMLIGQKLHL